MARRAELVSAADANRNFSGLLSGVRQGRSFIITSHGKPVARMVPFEEDQREASVAHRALLARLDAETAVDVGRWTRESLYEGGD